MHLTWHRAAGCQERPVAQEMGLLLRHEDAGHLMTHRQPLGMHVDACWHEHPRKRPQRLRSMPMQLAQKLLQTLWGLMRCSPQRRQMLLDHGNWDGRGCSRIVDWAQLCP